MRASTLNQFSAAFMSTDVAPNLKCAIWRLLACVMEEYRQQQMGRTYLTMAELLPKQTSPDARQDLLAFNALVWNYVQAEMKMLSPGGQFPYNAFLRDVDLFLGRIAGGAGPLRRRATYDSQLRFTGKEPKSILVTARNTFGPSKQRRAGATS